MLNLVDSGITFMFSKSGLPNDYDLFLGKMIEPCDNRCLRLGFKEITELVYRCADVEECYLEFKTPEELKKYVCLYFEIECNEL